MNGNHTLGHNINIVLNSEEVFFFTILRFVHNSMPFGARSHWRFPPTVYGIIASTNESEYEILAVLAVQLFSMHRYKV